MKSEYSARLELFQAETSAFEALVTGFPSIAVGLPFEYDAPHEFGLGYFGSQFSVTFFAVPVDRGIASGQNDNYHADKVSNR